MKKGFTLVELLGVIAVLAILSGIAIIAITSIVSGGRKKVYEDYKKTLENGTQNYLINHFEKMPTVNGNSTIKYTDLMDDDSSYKSLKDPGGSGNCDESYVIVSRGADTGINFNLTYKACIICGSYKSEGC